MNTQDSTKEDELHKAVEVMPPYVRQISESMVILGEAVSLALNLRDHAVIQEMKNVCGEIFEQAEVVLQDNNRNVQ